MTAVLLCALFLAGCGCGLAWLLWLPRLCRLDGRVQVSTAAGLAAQFFSLAFFGIPGLAGCVAVVCLSLLVHLWLDRHERHVRPVEEDER